MPSSQNAVGEVRPCCSPVYLRICLRRRLSQGSFLSNPHQPQAYCLVFSPSFEAPTPDENCIFPDCLSNIKLWINFAPTSLRFCLLIFGVKFLSWTSFHWFSRHLFLQWDFKKTLRNSIDLFAKADSHSSRATRMILRRNTWLFFKILSFYVWLIFVTSTEL